MEGTAYGTCGQSTLEYALVLFAFLASITALGAVLSFLQSPQAFEQAIDSSAHVLSGQDVLGTAQDLAVF